MRGSTLTTLELLHYLRCRVARLQRLGLDRAQAIHAVAMDDGIDEAKLAVLLADFADKTRLDSAA